MRARGWRWWRNGRRRGGAGKGGGGRTSRLLRSLMRGFTPQLSLTRGSGRSPSSFAGLTEPMRPNEPPQAEAASASSTVALIGRGRSVTPREHCCLGVIGNCALRSSSHPIASTARKNARVVLAAAPGMRTPCARLVCPALAVGEGGEEGGAQGGEEGRAGSQAHARLAAGGDGGVPQRQGARWLRTAQHSTARELTGLRDTSRPSTHAYLVSRCFRTSTTPPAHSSSVP